MREYMTVAERVELDRRARARAPRGSHSAFEARSDRDPIATLQQEAADRVPELLPIRYARMKASPLA
jgi:hypothetical protein